MKEISLYIHIPFCKEKCKYCDFLSFRNIEFVNDYKDALLKEINAFDCRDMVKSIFIGGGTPSYIEERTIAEIMECLNKFNIAPNAEITIEANPGTLTEDKLKLYKRFGINRISMGLQTWHNSILQTLGRIHTREIFLENYEIVKKYFDNINVDLMFSLPDQSFDMWAETLENVTALEPSHISAYSLIVEEGTPFYNMELNLPDEMTDRKMYHYTIDYLDSKDYKQYEISNFAKEGKNSQHNIVYWKRGNYKGFGIGSASLLDNIRYKNTESMRDYINGTTIVETEILTQQNIIEEYMFLGLRMIEGISVFDFKRQFGKNVFDVYGNVFDKYSDCFLINDRIALNRRGIDISNIIMSEFIF